MVFNKHSVTMLSELKVLAWERTSYWPSAKLSENAKAKSGKGRRNTENKRRYPRLQVDLFAQRPAERHVLFESSAPGAPTAKRQRRPCLKRQSANSPPILKCGPLNS